MLNELIHLLASEAFQEDGSITIINVRLLNGQLAIHVDVCLPDPIPVQSWYVFCDALNEHQIVLGRHDDLEFSSDHVLLWPYHQPQARLSFLGTLTDPFRAVGALHNAHQSCVGSWFAFERFFNPMMPLEMLLGGPAGTLAQGPIALLEAYRDALISVGLEPTLRGVSSPKEWNVNASVDISSPRTVAIFDRLSFVIGGAFQAVRVDSR